MDIIRQIVNRCNVGDSNRKVIRYVISRLKNKEQTFWNMNKYDRKVFMKSVIKEHHLNKQMYNIVNRL